MARQRLMVGTYGEISCFRLKSGSWQARARYCEQVNSYFEPATVG